MNDQNQQMYDDEAARQKAMWAKRKADEEAGRAANPDPMPIDYSAHSIPGETPHQHILRRNK